jgi:uncharacterized damage-inducible protein DinB
MLATTLQTLYLRDLNKLIQELLLYKKEEHIWSIHGEILNSAGNLCLHLIGNLNAYIGAVLGNTGYVRNRPAEFSSKNIPRAALISDLEDTVTMIEKIVGALSDEQLNSEYPQPVLNGKTTTSYFLVHLAMHLSYHLGQINYHRRLVPQ